MEAVFVTTASNDVALLADVSFDFGSIYGGVGNWLFDVLFGVDSISPQLREAGSKIVDNCGDRLVSVVKALLFLIKREISLDLWSKIAADPENTVFMVADELSEV